MSAHTPGPWVQFCIKGQTISILPAGRSGEICTFAGLPTKADADLMNAAPDLLEALKICAEVIKEYHEYEHDGDPWKENAREMGEMSIDDMKHDGRMQQVLATIAKAEGRS